MILLNSRLPQYGPAISLHPFFSINHVQIMSLYEHEMTAYSLYLLLSIESSAHKVLNCNEKGKYGLYEQCMVSDRAVVYVAIGMAGCIYSKLKVSMLYIIL